MRRPDLVFFHPQRVGLVDATGPIKHRPDLCVEVVSPGIAAVDRHAKRVEYADFGVRDYWIVDPSPDELSLMAMRRVGEAYTEVARGQRDDVMVLPPFDGQPLDSLPALPPCELELSRLWWRR